MEQLRELIRSRETDKALELAGEIDFRKLKNQSDISLIANLYLERGMLTKAHECLIEIYTRGGSRRILMQLINLAVRMKNVREAERYFIEFKRMAPEDFYNYIFRYNIDKIEGKPLAVLIESLEKLKKAEYIDEWAYELAKLYHKAGERRKCIDECDDLIIWFGQGEYVERAKALRAYYLGEIDIDNIGSAESSAQEADEEPATEEYDGEYDEEYDEEELSEGEPSEEEPENIASGIGEAEEEEPESEENDGACPGDEAFKEEYQSEEVTEVSGGEYQPDTDGEEYEYGTGAEVSGGEYEYDADEEPEEEEDEADTEAAEEPLPVVVPELDPYEQMIYGLLEKETNALAAKINADFGPAENNADRKPAAEGQDGKKSAGNTNRYADSTTENDSPADETEEEYTIQDFEAGEDGQDTEAEHTGQTADAEEYEEEPEAESEEEPEEQEADIGEQEAMVHEFRALRDYPIPEGSLLEEFLEKSDSELKDYFGYFAYNRDVRNQLIKQLELLLNPQIHNICLVISGEKQSGKKTIIKGVTKILRRSGFLRKEESSALITAEKVNRMKLSEKADRLIGCCLVIDSAGRLNADSAENLLEANEIFLGKTAVILTDTRSEINKLFRSNRDLNSMFPIRIHIPSFSAEDLTDFAFVKFENAGYELAADAEQCLKKVIRQSARVMSAGRLSAIDKYFSAVIENADTRIAKEFISLTLAGVMPKRRNLIIESDFPEIGEMK